MAYQLAQTGLLAHKLKNLYIVQLQTACHKKWNQLFCQETATIVQRFTIQFDGTCPTDQEFDSFLKAYDLK